MTKQEKTPEDKVNEELESYKKLDEIKKERDDIKRILDSNRETMTQVAKLLVKIAAQLNDIIDATNLRSTNP